MKNKTGWRFMAICCMTAASLAAHAGGGKHQHGVAHLDVALEGGLLSLHLGVPLDSLLGFERQPRTAAERSAAEAVLKRLAAAATLWQPSPEAQCRLIKNTVDAPVLQSASAPVGAEQHDDLRANIEFQCAAPTQLKGLSLGLFEAFKRLQRIEVQVAGPQGQFQRVLKRPTSVLSLTR